MNLKKTVCVLLSCAALMGTNALAKDNIYTYNKFVSTIIGPQTGYCDFAASFAGHENEYDNVNDYFSGLISAFYDDIDGDNDNELITVDSRGVSVYRSGENGVVFLGSADADLIANYGNSYANVFTVQDGRKKYIGIEKYGKTANEYQLYLYDLNPDTDELSTVLEISSESNEDGTEQNVWAKEKTYYSYTNAYGLQTSINPDNYASCASAAYAAVTTAVPGMKIESAALQSRIEAQISGDDFRFKTDGVELKTYIHAVGLRFTEKPIVIFEDYSALSELKEKPDMVTVMLDGQALQFPTQDPIIVDGRTLVPLRTIFEALGCEVDWNEVNGVQKITASRENDTIEMTINSAEYFVNGEKKALDVPAQLINDKTLVPLRAVSESLGCNVEWNQDTKTVTIQSNN